MIIGIGLLLAMIIIWMGYRFNRIVDRLEQIKKKLGIK